MPATASRVMDHASVIFQPGVGHGQSLLDKSIHVSDTLFPNAPNNEKSSMSLFKADTGRIVKFDLMHSTRYSRTGALAVFDHACRVSSETAYTSYSKQIAVQYQAKHMQNPRSVQRFIKVVFFFGHYSTSLHPTENQCIWSSYIQSHETRHSGDLTRGHRRTVFDPVERELAHMIKRTCCAS